MRLSRETIAEARKALAVARYEAAEALARSSDQLLQLSRYGFATDADVEAVKVARARWEAIRA